MGRATQVALVALVASEWLLGGSGGLMVNEFIPRGGIDEQPSEAWLAARRLCITGTDAPVLWGCGYDSYKTWLRKKTEWPSIPVPLNAAMRRGLELEPVLLDHFELLYVALERPAGLYVVGNIGASLDGISWKERIIVEAKTTVRVDDKKMARWSVQLQHQLYVMEQWDGTRRPFSGYLVIFCDDKYDVRKIPAFSDYALAQHLDKCDAALHDLGLVDLGVIGV